MNSASRRVLELLQELVLKEFKVRYKSTVLGFLWSLANPVFFAAVFYVAFGHILRVPAENYFVFLLAGLFPWQWFANTVNTSPTLYVVNAPLIKKICFPRLLLPLSAAGNHLIHFLLALAVALPVALAAGCQASLWWIPGIPLLILVQFMMIAGLSLALSSLNVYFRDLEHLTVILTNLLFYLTPILYPESVIPERYRWLFWVNPLHTVIPAWRNLVLFGTLDLHAVAVGAATGASLLACGYLIYRKLEGRLAELV